MSRDPSAQPNDVELAILSVLWECGPSSIRDVHNVLRSSRNRGYTSTSKMMQVMCDKGLLVRDESVRPQIYKPAVPEAQTQKSMLHHLIDKAFGGSARKLVLRAVETQKIKPQERAEILKLLAQLKGDDK